MSSDQDKDDCVFCAYSRANPPGQINGDNVFLSTDTVLGFLDIQPLVTSAAHVLIIPRKHYSKLHEMNRDERSAGALGIALSKVSNILTKIVDQSAFNIVQNNGIEAGQVVDHVHFHIVLRPRVPDPQAEKLHNLILNGSPGEKWSLKERLSYSSVVYAKGAREDLDVDWSATLVPRLRALMRSRL